MRWPTFTAALRLSLATLYLLTLADGAVMSKLIKTGKKGNPTEKWV